MNTKSSNDRRSAATDCSPHVSDWYKSAGMCPTNCCCRPDGRCSDCQPDGFCETCDTFEGRGIDQINEYASTCDGCYELVHHDLQRIPDGSDDQLGYCEECRPDLFIDDE